jgi:Cys-tRNA(Pro)/Cys-tRNA(Cys) deacylase
VTAPTPAVAVLLEAGVAHRLIEYDHQPGATSFGDEAVASLGLDPARVYKTLVVTADEPPDGRLFVGVVPVAARLDPKAMGAAVGCKRVRLAEARAVERSTGYVVGAISPLGQRRARPTVVDTTALGWDTVFCSGGRRGLELELAPADLVRLTGATVAAIGR